MENGLAFGKGVSFMSEPCPYDNDMCPLADSYYLGHSLWAVECTADPETCEGCDPPQGYDK